MLNIATPPDRLLDPPEIDAHPKKRKARVPKSCDVYGQFAWHLKWTVDLPNRQVSHVSGVAYRFTTDNDYSVKPPLAGICPTGSWMGRLSAGHEVLARRKRHAAARLCLEALQLFDDLARFSCQDCGLDTMDDNYYMVHDSLWRKAHPKLHGMLCLPCLQRRVGRRLTLDDFTPAPINYFGWVLKFCSSE